MEKVFFLHGRKVEQNANALFSPKYSIGISVGEVSDINLKYPSACFMPVGNQQIRPCGLINNPLMEEELCKIFFP